MAYIQDDKGNYKRTVRCGYCYETGHNKSSCPAKKQAHTEAIAKMEKRIAADDFTDEFDRAHAHHILEHNKQQLAKRNARGKNRKCSFCGEVGHTKRTCTLRKKSIVDWKAALTRQQEAYTQSCVRHGLGPGTLVEVVFNRTNHLGMVTQVDLTALRHSHDITPAGHYYGSPGLISVTFIRPVEVNNWGQTRVREACTMQLPFDVHNFTNAPATVSEHRSMYDGFCASIVSPVDNPVVKTFDKKHLDEVAKELADEYVHDLARANSVCMYEET